MARRIISLAVTVREDGDTFNEYVQIKLTWQNNGLRPLSLTFRRSLDQANRLRTRLERRGWQVVESLSANGWTAKPESTLDTNYLPALQQAWATGQDVDHREGEIPL